MTPKTPKLVANVHDIFETYPNPHNVTRATYRKVLTAFNYLLGRDAVNTGDSYQLPNQTGLFGVYKKKTSARGYFDYHTYNTLGIKRYLKNAHSGGYRATIK
jgi:hypothetical protein